MLLPLGEKMAPVCVACRLLLATLFVIVVFVSIVISNVSSLLVYDRQTLLDLRPSAKDLVKVDYDGHTTFQPLQFPRRDAYSPVANSHSTPSTQTATPPG